MRSFLYFFMVIFSSASFGKEITQPCDIGNCEERCFYRGKSSFNGNFELETRFTNQQNLITARILLRFTAKYLFWNIEYLIDEIDFLEPGKNNDLRSIFVNTRYLVNDNIKRQKWDRFDFDQVNKNTKAWRLQGNNEGEFRGRYPYFIQHFPSSNFGQDWVSDYIKSQPEARGDMETHGFNNSIISPLYLSFFKIRFLNSGQGPQEFSPFLGAPPKDKNTTKPMRLIPQKISNGNIIWESDLYIHGLSSPKGKTTKYEVDPNTHFIKSMHLFLKDGMASIESKAELVECKIFSKE